MRPEYSLNEWISHPNNLNAYKKWRDSPVTQMILDGLRWQNPPPSMPSNMISGDTALFFHGVSCGVDRILRRMETLDVIPEKMDTPDHNYGVDSILLEAGFTPDDIVRIKKEAKKNA